MPAKNQTISLFDQIKEAGHITQIRKGEDFVKVAGVLYGVMSKTQLEEIHSIETDCLAVDMDKGFALFKCTITTVTGKTFTGHGDATQKNCGSMVRSAFYRMAETRALGRAARVYLSKELSMTCFEELPLDVAGKIRMPPAPKPPAKLNLKRWAESYGGLEQIVNFTKKVCDGCITKWPQERQIRFMKEMDLELSPIRKRFNSWYMEYVQLEGVGDGPVNDPFDEGIPF